ncbi:hypothetical protein HDU98_008432 [Podochytrium sp. JEL0797]|nr:hypothetical protein HDU98_008432 [Podochytrium sp. JEL0797]
MSCFSSLPPEIVQEILVYLPLERDTLVATALASRRLFVFFSDSHFARRHVSHQLGSFYPRNDLWAFLDAKGIRHAAFAALPIAYQTALTGEILQFDDWFGIKGWVGSDMTTNKMWYLRWKLDPERALEIMRDLLDDKKHFNPTSQKNRSFRWACRSGYLGVVQLLLQDGRCDPCADDNYAIQCASESGEIEIVRLLLATSPSVNPGSNHGYAIKLASRHGHETVVSRLLQDPRVDPTENMDEAIRNASANGHAGVVRLLLTDLRVDPSIFGNYSFREACHNGHADVVRALLADPRVDPNFIQGARNLPLSDACSNGREEVVRVLLGDARIDPTANSGEATWNALAGGFEQIVKLLLRDARVQTGLGPGVFEALKTSVDDGEMAEISQMMVRLRGEADGLAAGAREVPPEEADDDWDEMSEEDEFEEFDDAIGDVAEPVAVPAVAESESDPESEVESEFSDVNFNDIDL